ncbi:hypothetical protein V525_17445 [Gordonia alkanivorans CGMCC 6845]|uniref:Uncharacterized protein n=1 Tax=Gordonia alkanivorans CGMCC 6845 TaxID=1423140 RepID=W9DB77_9ACTN|nr:hypothetical protein V525_17445 [Gordonia alkanivorans CGMCC 6845]
MQAFDNYGHSHQGLQLSGVQTELVFRPSASVGVDETDCVGEQSAAIAVGPVDPHCLDIRICECLR